MRILNRSFNSERDAGLTDPNESLDKGSSKYAFALKESGPNSKVTSEQDNTSEGNEMKILNLNDGTVTPKSEQHQKLPKGTKNLMGLLEEVGSLGSLEDSVDSIRSSDA